MDAKRLALGLYGLVAFQMGSDPDGTQAGIKGAFTSANGVAKQIPVLFDTSGIASSPAPTPADPGAQTVSLSDGREVTIPRGYRLVQTGN